MKVERYVISGGVDIPETVDQDKLQEEVRKVFRENGCDCIDIFDGMDVVDEWED